LQEISSDEYNTDDESNYSSDLGSAEGKPPVSLKQAKFSLKEVAQRIGQANYSAFNKWRKRWVAGFIEKKHRSITWGQNRLKQLRDVPLHWETEVTDFLKTFKTRLRLDNFDNAE
jgi:transposase-like protein